MIKRIPFLLYLTIISSVSAQQITEQIEQAIIDSNLEKLTVLIGDHPIHKKDKERLLALSSDMITVRQEKVSHHTILMSLPISTCVSAGIMSYCSAALFSSASRTFTKFAHASIIKEFFMGALTLEKIACATTAGFITSCAALALWIKTAEKVRSHYQELEKNLIDAIKIYQKISQAEPVV